MRDYQWQLELKYSPDQPRVPAGDPRGGQWARYDERLGRAVPGGDTIGQRDFQQDGQSNERVRNGAARRLAARWDVAREDLEGVAREEGYTNDMLNSYTDDELKEQLARNILTTWEGSSGDILAVVAIKGVADRLGLSYDLSKYQKRDVAASLKYPGMKRAMESLGNAMYDLTQEWLKERGVKKVQLLRSGHRGKRSLHTSWATSWGGVRHQQGRKTIVETVRAKYIMSVPPTGFGSMAESEVVVLPRE